MPRRRPVRKPAAATRADLGAGVGTAEDTGGGSPMGTEVGGKRTTILSRGTIGLVAVAVAVTVVIVVRSGRSPGSSPGIPPGTDRQPGGTLGCRQLPRFAAVLGFSQRSALSTGEHDHIGLALVDLDDPTRIYQHPTWSAHGYLGPITYDADGNVFVAPTPNISLLDNPPEQQNTLYKVDTDTAELSELLRLPMGPPPAENPFGILGLTYDCDTHGLFASTVAGSTRRSEVGRIVRIDPARPAVVDALPDVDAMGLAVFNAPAGKRLYFGTARRPEIWSVALDATGYFQPPARRAVRIPGLAHKARRITFDAVDHMTVVGVPFDFTLNASSRDRHTTFAFRYDAGTDAWTAEAGSPEAAAPAPGPPSEAAP